MLQKFKNIVDTTTRALENGSLSYIEEINNHHDTHYRNIREALYSNINLELIPFPQFFAINDELVYRHVLYQDDIIKYINLLDYIRDASDKQHKKIPTLENTKVWEKVIINAISFGRRHPNGFMAGFPIRDHNPKAFDKAKSAQRLIDFGYPIIIENQHFSIVGGPQPIIDDIENSIKKLGGLTVINHLFHLLHTHKKYNNDLKRYFLTRSTNSYEVDQVPDVPFGYILNLAAKYSYSGSFKPQDGDIEWKNIIDKSVLLTNVLYDVQSYSIWETHFQYSNLVPFIQKLVTYDTIYNVVQEHPDMAIASIKGIFSHLDTNKISTVTGLTLDEINSILLAIRLITRNGHGPQVIYLTMLIKELPSINSAKLTEFMKRMSLPLDKVNPEFSLPSDYNEIDFMFAPLVQVSDTKYILLESSWRAPAYFEALGVWLRNNGYPQFEQEVGMACEAYIYDLLKEKNIDFFSGDYENEEITGECDLIFETREAIILIEIKKKALTRPSKSGSDLGLLIDLSDSLLYSQVQAGRSEILLRKNGKITLKNREGLIRTIEWKKRDIMRISVTQQDFGAFQDKNVVDQFLTSLLIYKYEPISKEDESVVKRFNKLNKKAEELRNQYVILKSLNHKFADRQFLYCWFLSIPQLKLMIHNSSDNETLYAEMKRTKHLTTSSLDFYLEYWYARHLEGLPVLN